MYIRKKTFVLTVTYLTAGLIALGAANLVSCAGDYRRADEYAYRHAFDEVVLASQTLADALHRGAYATGPELSASVCADVYGSCLAAGMTLGALPFSAQELERTAGFIGTAGDYAHSLLRTAAEKGFTDTERRSFSELYALAGALSDELSALSDEVHSGQVLFDEPENRFSAVGEGSGLYASMLKLEAGMGELPELCYDGDYTAPRPKAVKDPVSEEKAKEIALTLPGVDEAALRLSWQSEAGACCFECGDMSITVDGAGRIVSVSSSGVPGSGADDETMQKAAEKLLGELGIDTPELISSEREGNVLYFDYGCGGSVPRECDRVRIGIAADTGGLYSLDATAHYNAPEAGNAAPSVSEEEARGALPDGVSAERAALVFAEDTGGRERLCWDFPCSDGDTELHILVDADTGRSFAVRFAD